MGGRFEPPAAWARLRTIDAHTAGEPLRVVVSGWPEIPGDSILAKRRFAAEHHDHLRRALMWEPRGHADMYGCILTDPVTPDGDVGVLFMHNEGYSTMCGHGIIGLVTVALETGLLAPDALERDGAHRPIIRIDTPAGRVTAFARMRFESGFPRVTDVSFENVPSFVIAPDLEVEVEGTGAVRCDIAFGGAFYAYVDAADVGLALEPRYCADIIAAGQRLKAAVADRYAIAHPAGDADLGFLYGTIFVAPGEGEIHSRNVCVFADGEVDRSPTGTGVSGRAAIHAHRGDLAFGEAITIDSLIGTSFDVRITGTSTIGGLPAVIPEVTGSAHLTGRHEFFIDPGDPLRGGFILR
jgi:trans-L-3-hydroxyproline dehydratase